MENTLLKKIIHSIHNIIMLPQNINTIAKNIHIMNNSHLLQQEKPFQEILQTSTNVEAMFALMVLRESNPSLVAELIPNLELPESTLKYDAHGRYLHEAAIEALRTGSSAMLRGFLRGLKSLPR